MSVAASTKQYKFALEITSGPRKGERIDFDSDRISIGRSKDNTISFTNDNKVSRHHAVIEVMNDSVLISNVSEKNILKVNSQSIRNANLKDGDLIIIGTTEIKFFYVKFGVAKSTSEQSLIVLANQLPEQQGNVVSATPTASPLNANHAVNSKVRGAANPKARAAHWEAPKPKKSKTTFYLIVALVGGVFIWLLTSDTSPKEEDLGLRTREQIKAEITASESTLQELKQSRSKKGNQSNQWLKAQAAFVKGRRDYQNLQYGRAIQSFQAALSIFPNHVLSRQYLRLSRRKFDEVIQQTMIQARKYREKRNYKLCTSQFALVMTMIRDNQNNIYKEAKQFHDECAFRLEGAY